jgi:N-succinyldiaminopimelate aminotransferase
VKQFLTFVNAGPLQPAVAHALGLPGSYFTGFTADLRAKRDLLAAGLSEAGFRVYPPEGTYFITADIADLAPGVDGVQFCRSLPEKVGVVAIPTQVFHDDETAGASVVRFAFCKRIEVLDEAVSRLRKLSG